MSIEKLDYFVSAARHRNFTRAAQECGVAQSAISQQISSLEKDLKCELFCRSGRNVRLTHQGECFLLQAQKLQEEYQQAVLQARQAAMQQSRKTLRIGIAGLHQTAGLMTAILKLKQSEPEVQVVLERCEAEQMERLLRQREYDVVLGYVEGTLKEGLAFEPMCTRKLQLYLPQEFPQAGKGSFELSEVLLWPGKVYLSRVLYQYLQKRRRFSPRERERLEIITDTDMVLPMGVLNRSAVLTLNCRMDQNETMVSSEISYPDISLQEVLLYRKDSCNPMLRKLLESL